MTRRPSDRFWVVTGGPGAGKTALIDALAAIGLARVSESGRAIIREQMASRGDALPWTDPAGFAAAMLERDLVRYVAAGSAEGPVFFDRGLPDIAGYRRLSGLPDCTATNAACRAHRYNRRVFIAPPWPEIYATDAERRQTAAEAERTYRAMAAIYPAFGYELVELPRTSVAERVAFVLGHIA